MPVTQISVAGYRSVRDLDLTFSRINVLTGPNGSGKSNLYNSLVLIANAAHGQFARAIAAEGGTPSVFWAGGERVRLTRKKPPKRVILSFESDLYGYEIQAGIPSPHSHPPGTTMFKLDPEVKEETIWPAGSRRRLPLMFNRQGPSAWLRNEDGAMVEYPFALLKYESGCRNIEPHRFPEISAVRNEILCWRFYHHFRTDADSPLRQPQIGVQTPVLSHDASDLAAALETIVEIGDDAALAEAVANAFGGARLEIQCSETQFSVFLRIPGMLRALHAREFSDGQLPIPLPLCRPAESPPSFLARLE